MIIYELDQCIFSGGFNGASTKEILEFNLQTESWTEIGSMKEGKRKQAVSVVSFADYEKWCN